MYDPSPTPHTHAYAYLPLPWAIQIAMILRCEPTRDPELKGI